MAAHETFLLAPSLVGKIGMLRTNKKVRHWDINIDVNLTREMQFSCILPTLWGRDE